MNSKFKRLLACLLSLMMVVSLFPLSAVTASAAENDETSAVTESEIESSGTWGGIDWTLTSDGTLTISPIDAEVSTMKKQYDKSQYYKRGEIPAAVNDKVSAVIDPPWGPSNVITMIIEEGVTSIGSFALQNHMALTGELVIPSTLTYIGQQGLQHADNLEKLTFAKGGKETLCIGVQSLAYLKNVKEVILPDDRPVHVHCWAFKGCDKLETVCFPASVEVIGYNTHYDYQNKNVAESFIFNLCPKLENVKFGSPEVYKMFTSWGDAYKGMGEAIKDKIKNDPIKDAVAMIGEQSYATLADALAAANQTAGNYTIKLFADNAETITFAQKNGVNITIDGNGKTFSGKINISGAGNFTVEDATLFAAAAKTIVIETGAANCPNITIKECTLTSAQTASSYYGSTAIIKATNSPKCDIVISDCEVSNLYYAVYVPQGGQKLVIENSTFTDCVYLASAMKCADVIVKDVEYTGMAGIMVRNSVNSTLALENVKITTTLAGQTPVAMLQPDSGNGVKYTITLKGENIANGAEMTVANESDWFVRQNESNPYEIINLNGLKGSGTEADPYQIGSLNDLIMFRDSVNAGETKYNAPGVYVVLTADIDLADENWAAIGSATQDHGFMGNFDGNGFKIKNLTITDPALDSDGYAYAGFFGITEGTDKNNQNVIKNLVIENVTISTTGHIVAGAIAYPYYTILENITVCGNIAIEGGDYTAGVLAYTRRCTTASNITISGNAGSYITGAKTVGGVISDIQMNGGLTANYSNFSASGLTITGDMHVGGISGIICNQTLNGATVKNVTLVCTDARVGIVAGSLGGTATIKDVETSKVTGTKNIVGADFSTGKAVANKDDKYGIATAWINKVGYFITLADAVEYVNGLNKTSLTYIDLLRDSEGPGFVVKAPVQIEFNGYTYTITKGVGSTGTESNGIQQLSGNLVLKKGALKVADSIADKMYILIQSYDDLTVTGMTLDGTNLDKWSKHEDQVVNGDSYVVSKNNGNFAINTSNIITNNDGSKAFAFDLCDQRSKGYMDLPYASVAATTTINGAPVKESLDKVEAVANYSTYYYATIEQAIAKHPSAALIGDVVLKDTVVVPAGKTFTLDLNGHTITMKTAEYKSAIENNGTLTIKDSGENGGIAMIFTGTASTAKAVNAISNRGKLTVQGGNISNSGNGNQIGYAIDNYNGATLTVKGGNITASGSTYYDAIRLFCGSKETKVTVSGGYVSSIWAQNPSANKASEVNGSVVVTGGEIGTIYYENYTTVTITTKIAGNYNVVAYGANSENATSAKVAKNTVYSFAN